MKVVLLLGQPGSGKTALLRAILPALEAPAHRELELRTPMANGQLSNRARGTLYPRHKILVPGVYDGSLFEGTDRLGRNTTPALTEMVLRLGRIDPNYNVLCEGDRIATTTFVDAIVDAGIALEVYWLLASPDECAARKAAREAERGEEFFSTVASKTVAGKPRREDRLKTGLDAKWVAGRDTKVRNLAAHAANRGMFVSACPNGDWREHYTNRSLVCRALGVPQRSLPNARLHTARA